MSIQWTYKKFSDLSTLELYKILHLRNQVFVVEQNCPYNDTDEKDFDSFHLSGYVNNDLAAYSRILPPGLAYSEASIGRVVTSPHYRKHGFGILLMKEAINKCHTQFNAISIRIGAQLYLRNFYSNLGFTPASEMYLEDNIPHIEMLRHV